MRKAEVEEPPSIHARPRRRDLQPLHVPYLERRPAQFVDPRPEVLIGVRRSLSGFGRFAGIECGGIPMPRF